MEESRSSRILHQLKDICEIVGIRTEEHAKISKKWVDVKLLTRELNREKRYLGDRVVELREREDRGDIYDDITVKAILGRIQTLEDSLAGHEEDISVIRDEASLRASSIRQRAEEESISQDQWERDFTVDQDEGADDDSWDDSEVRESSDLAGEGDTPGEQDQEELSQSSEPEKSDPLDDEPRQ